MKEDDLTKEEIVALRNLLEEHIKQCAQMWRNAFIMLLLAIIGYLLVPHG